MQVLIIEDEPLGVERLEIQLKEIDPFIQIIGITESIQSSVTWLEQHAPPDLIFMDIELADGQSFEIFRKVIVTSPVIFTTSYDEYALQAFKVNSIDYLLKPIKKEELRHSIQKFRQLKQLYGQGPSLDIEKLVIGLKQQQPKEYRSRFLVKQGQRYVSVEVAEIAYFYVEERLTFFKTWNKIRYVVDYSLDELEKMLSQEDFNRINKSFIVHIKAIAHIHSYFHGKLKLELSPSLDKEVLVSRESATSFKRWMGK
ncbi:LytR/AlgR family response regulator transcription factor [Adhaeribacter radiodurans]|uniref:Response regulator transcription factor n=1 Tax=Adhaeribacter radiodurans TaxID=2745197 RepID=A0A7L7L703_9BACT|nr:LytTR family DNA-binding domain-containing protein [Adhaeribacter radiodurans]QMU28129.1 response regulator transcription factor [Adhaeribacter radiodurans]